MEKSSRKLPDPQTSKPLASVFLDTNILKFAAVKRHVYRPVTSTVNWGGSEFEVEHHEPYTVNSINKIQHEPLKRDAVFLGMLAYAGISGNLSFHASRETEVEFWGLPGIMSASGRFFDCPIQNVPDPVDVPHRLLFGGGKGFKENTLAFVSSIKNPRYLELIKMTGAYQGKEKPLNLNQALDAYHIWCAEHSGIDYFLTMDYKLQRLSLKSKASISTTLITPDRLLRQITPKLGIAGAIKFLWNGYRFAKPRVGFTEGSGWI